MHDAWNTAEVPQTTPNPEQGKKQKKQARKQGKLLQSRDLGGLHVHGRLQQ